LVLLYHPRSAKQAVSAQLAAVVLVEVVLAAAAGLVVVASVAE